MRRILMARQPIFDAAMEVVAYELLYRTLDGGPPTALLHGEAASSEVLLSRYTGLTRAGRMRTVPAFVNITQQMLETEALPAIPPEQLVIEVLEDVEPTTSLLGALRRYSEAGYTIALDDFTYSHAAQPLLELADIVKLDVRALDRARLAEHAQLLRAYKVRLLAEKVETHEELEYCRRIGCELFQGYFLRRPELVTGRSPESNRLILLQLLARFDDPEASTQGLVALIERDPALSYRLLRVLNSAALGLRQRVSSLKEALVKLGRKEVRKWVALLLVGAGDGKPTELIRQLLLIARMCELTALASGLQDPDKAFLAGLMQHIHALLDTYRETIFEEVAISDEIREAVTDGSGAIGRILAEVECFVDGRWSELDDAADLDALQRAYEEALDWTVRSMEAIVEA